MKKILTVIILAVLLAALGVTAIAETTEERINEIACKHEKVVDAKSILYERVCVVAIRTEKFVSREEYDKYRDELIDEIKSNFEADCVIVTRNPKIMNEINSLNKLDETEKDRKIQEIIDKALSKIQPRDKIIMPKKSL